ncbi:uncharacterized protein LOC131215421 [Anopheles bellator]|uniref:uncharacterized protein LOC131215421 n=1 Tax=Anopheles bellator TaxID=139047 RepID=UPI00264A301C|nr:uncharacterized protein LOC131215421 [Anopheles bellator]
METAENRVGANRKQQNKQQVGKNLSVSFQKFSAERPEEILKAHVDECPTALAQYVNDFAFRSEKCALERLENSPEFLQCASWSVCLDSFGFRETCNNELPLALKSIAFTEPFPKPEHVNGVNFQMLYLNLACMMMGQPIRGMNASTRKVLKDVYEQTVLKISQTDHNEDITLLHEKLKTMAPPQKSKRKLPITKDLKTFFADPNINPFKIPMEKIVKKDGTISK